jgi:hypothetical protein
MEKEEAVKIEEAPEPEELVICFECKEKIPEDGEYSTLRMQCDGDVHVVCESCVEDLYECSGCEEWLNANDITQVDGDKGVCDACLDAYSKCNDCGTYVSNEESMSDFYTNVYVCAKCYENNYFTCQSCEHIHHVDSYAEDGYCDDCWKEDHPEEEDESGYVEPSSKIQANSGAERYSQGTTLVHFECAVKTFYIMYALEEKLSRKRSDLAYIVKRDLLMFSSKFARALFDYMAMACIGEARHAQWVLAEKQIMGFYPSDNRPPRNEVYDNLAAKVDPISSAPALSEVFGSNWKEKGYGGKKWKSITDAYATYHDRISDISFIDMVINKRHNGSLAFDKGIIFKMPSGPNSIISFLDFRREDDALNFDKMGKEASVKFWPIIPELFDLLECAVRERAIQPFSSKGVRLYDIKWFPPVKWGSVVLEACKNETWVEKCKDLEICKVCGCGHKSDDCTCELTSEDEHEEENTQSAEGYYDGKYSEYRKTVKGLADMAQGELLR